MTVIDNLNTAQDTRLSGLDFQISNISQRLAENEELDLDRLSYLGGSFNALRSRIEDLNQAMATAETESIYLSNYFHTYSDNDPEVSTTLAGASFADNSFGGQVDIVNEYKEIAITKITPVNLSAFRPQNGYLEFEIYVENPEAMNEINTEIGNVMDQSEIQWNKVDMPYLTTGWNTVKLPISSGWKTGSIDWSALKHFRVYVKSTELNVLKLRDIKLTVQEQRVLSFSGEPIFTLSGASVNLTSDENQNAAIITAGAKLDELNTNYQSLDSRVVSLDTAVMNQGERLTSLEEQMNTIRDEHQALMDFYTAFELGNVLLKDAEGNVNLASGKLESGGIVAGAFTVRITEAEKKTIGEENIIPLPKDENFDTLDDFTGLGMTDPQVTARDGRTIFVATRAITDTCKIFTNFETNPGSVSWVEKVRDEVTQEFIGFRVHLQNPCAEQVKVNWWIVEKQ
jgi:hypothetical protein